MDNKLKVSEVCEEFLGNLYMLVANVEMEVLEAYGVPDYCEELRCEMDGQWYEMTVFERDIVTMVNMFKEDIHKEFTYEEFVIDKIWQKEVLLKLIK